MINNYSLRFASFILALSVLIFPALGHAQFRVFATEISNQFEVVDPAFVMDADMGTKAIIEAYSGTILGTGAFSGNLELRFPLPIAENTTSFIKLDADDPILAPLLGGNLSPLLSEISGDPLLGKQNFSVTAKSGNTTVLSGQSSIASDFENSSLNVVIDKNQDFFLALTPQSLYDRIGLQNNVGSLLGIDVTRELGVYEAFYALQNSQESSPSFTSYKGENLTSDLLSELGTGVTAPELAIDGDNSTSSSLGLGVLDFSASIEQHFYFESSTHANDTYYVRLQVEPALFNVGITHHIDFTAHNGIDVSESDLVLSQLLSSIDSDTLQNGEAVTIAISPTTPTNRLTVRLSSLMGIILPHQMRIFEVFKAPAEPIIDAESENSHICAGASATLTARNPQADTAQMRWYDSETGGTLLATLNSGEAFNSPSLNADTTFYVAAGDEGSSEESPRVAVMVNVSDIPVADDIIVRGNENAICSSSNINLVPSSPIEGTFNWFLDADATLPIMDTTSLGEATFQIGNEGGLTVSGLDEANSPTTFYVALTQAAAGCQNMPGNLKPVTVSVVDSNLAFSIDSDIDLVTEDLLNLLGVGASKAITGTLSGDVASGDTIDLMINGTNYGATLNDDLEFNVMVDGIDLIMDADSSIETSIDTGSCSLTSKLQVSLPALPVTDLLQIFCASDSPTVADLQVDTDGILFFESLESDIILDADTPLVDGNVYFAGMLNVPNSILARVAITVELIEVPSPTTDSGTQVFCVGTSPTLADLRINESNVRFYDQPSEGSELDPATPLMDDSTYYVAQIEGDCESTSRFAIAVAFVENEPIGLDGTFENVCLLRPYTYTTESNKQNYLWSVDGGTIIDGGLDSDPFVTVSWDSLADTSIRVSYTDSLSCIPEKSVSVDVASVNCGEIMSDEFCLFVYNEFTPNNDGFNDFFEVRCIENYISSLRVFNRNGNQVYEAQNYRNDWDGIANVSGTLNTGDHLPSGTYYYVINLPELNRELVGWLQLARQ